ncbi:hypothetical protein HMPREF3151_03570 [Corynebacterium sp. HMSC05H05]|uniref:hypothetical protein n=1 Tax=Corynebacterium sp. HMSC05H05 TaxID=1581119 RepID=UPI0008A58D66|nr:hypothetical protein [Corynebacterium sp. HMSC05H05]OFT58760.1 hypothetical protein HMPREF3151_03570 [Corynebacterium sp. HMSC05H05]
MSTAVNSTADQLHSALFTLESAGVDLADDVEVDDIDDAVADHPVVFPTRPFAVLAQVAQLSAADGDPLFALARPGSLETRAARTCTAAGVELWRLAVVPDAKGSAAGSARVQFSEWDVADVPFDGPSPCFELAILAAIESRAL